MAEKKCPHCAMMIPRYANPCPFCKRDIPTCSPTFLRKIICGFTISALLAVLIGVIISLKKDNQSHPTKEASTRVAITGNPKLIEHLNEAKKALADTSSPDQPWGRIDDAKMHLLSIPQNAKEYGEAQKLMAEVQKKEKERGGVISVRNIRKDEAEIEKLLSQVCLGKLELIKFNWSRGGFETVAIINSMTIKNRGKNGCKDINSIMHFYAKSGTELGRSLFVIYDKIPAGKTKTFRDINVGFLPSPVEQVNSADVVILGGMTD